MAVHLGAGHGASCRGALCSDDDDVPLDYILKQISGTPFQCSARELMYGFAIEVRRVG